MPLFGFGKGKSASRSGSEDPSGSRTTGGKKPARTTLTVSSGSGREEKKESLEGKAAKSATAHGVGKGDNLSHILRNPRITEKATAHSAVGVYAFDVSERATKQSISQAVFGIYNVRPRMIRIVPVPSKMRRSARTGKRGISGGGKKAYVYLKRGDSITVS